MIQEFAPEIVDKLYQESNENPQLSKVYHEDENGISFFKEGEVLIKFRVNIHGQPIDIDIYNGKELNKKFLLSSFPGKELNKNGIERVEELFNMNPSLFKEKKIWAFYENHGPLGGWSDKGPLVGFTKAYTPKQALSQFTSNLGLVVERMDEEEYRQEKEMAIEYANKFNL